eukprot:COSAG02_NODE_11668_length_1677_cov_1.294043_2_plen_176_part_00
MEAQVQQQPDHSYAPRPRLSKEQNPMEAGARRGASVSSATLDVSTFLDLADRMQATIEAQKADTLTRLAASEAKVEQLRSEMVEARVHDAMLRDQLVSALLTRVEGLHDAKLVDDELRDIVEDAIADSHDPCATNSTVSCHVAEGDPVTKLIVLSGTMAHDRQFARQLQRKRWLS